MNGICRTLVGCLICLGAVGGCEQAATSSSTPVQSEKTTETKPVPSYERILCQDEAPTATVGIEGCWQNIENGAPRGSSFQFLKICPSSFVFEGLRTFTRLHFEGLNFKEINLNEDAPYYLKGSVISNGTISADGNTLTRFFPEKTESSVYKRCGTF